MKPDTAIAAAALTILLVTASTLTYAQDDDAALEAARACRAIADDAERLACLDDALGLSSRPAAEPERRTREPEAAEEPAVVRERVSESRESRRSARRAERAAEGNQTVRIVEIQSNTVGTTAFLTDDGDRWVQTSGNEGRYPNVPFDATLEPAMGESFFLVSPLGGPRVRVAPGE